MKLIDNHKVLTEYQVQIRLWCLRTISAAILVVTYFWMSGYIMGPSDWGYFDLVYWVVSALLIAFSLTLLRDQETILGIRQLGHRELKKMESRFNDSPAAAEVIIKAVNAGLTLRQRDKDWFDDEVNAQIYHVELSKALSTIASRSSE